VSASARAQLGEIAALQAGVGFPVDLQGRSSGDYPVAKVRDISRVGRSSEPVISAADNYIDEGDLARLRARPVPVGSVLFAKIGEAIRQNHRVIAGCALLVDNNAMAAIPTRRVESRYLFHFLRTVDFYGLASATTVPALRKSELERLSVPLPPLAEQQRIAEILDAADALRGKRREALVQLDTLLQSTFLDMFGDPVTNPMGWEETSLGELAQDSFRNGLSPSTKGAVDGEVLTLSAITGDRFDFAAKKRARFDKQPSPSQRLSSSTFLICRGNGNRRLVGTGAYPDRSSNRVCFPDTMIGVAISPSVLTAAYVQNVWRTRRVRMQIERGARTTNGTHKVNQRLLSSIVFPVPPVDLQVRFAAIVKSVEQQMAIQRAHLAELDTLFASLQSRAFRGDL